MNSPSLASLRLGGRTIPSALSVGKVFHGTTHRSLASLRALREETFVPGYGPVCDKRYLDEQSSFISEWVEYVRGGIERGMNKEECISNLTALSERYPMDVGQDGMAPRVIQINVANLYDYLTSAGIHAHR
jgi:hypothetical protein